MDPNAALRTIREAIARDLGNPDDRHGDELTTIAETVRGLDEWLTKGGFLPTEWDRQTRTWTLDGDGDVLRDLVESASGASTLRVSVDWGLLKWKRNEDMWTAGLDADR